MEEGSEKEGHPDAAEALGDTDLDPDQVEAKLKPLRGLADNREFWRHQEAGLAVFATPSWHDTFRLPTEVETEAAVGDRPYLTPLLPAITHDGRFLVLALSRNRVRLFESTRDAIHEVEPPDMPTSLAQAVGADFEQRALQFYSSTPGGRGHRSAEFHGQGVGRDDVDGEVSTFLNLVDAGIRSAVSDHDTPLVVAAVDELVGEFRKHAQYPTIHDRAVTGSPDQTPPEELREAAWNVIAPRFEGRRREATDRIRSQLGTGRATDQMVELVVAAGEGRIDTLILARGAKVAGRFDPDRREVTVHEQAFEDSVDLLNLAALETLAHDGDVFVFPSDEVPSETSSAAAALRF